VLIESLVGRGVSFQLANAAYVQFANLFPLSISQAGSLRHDSINSPPSEGKTTLLFTMTNHPSMWRSQVVVAAAAAIGLTLLSSCRSTPVTGRKQLLMVPESQEISLGIAGYQEILGQQPLSTNQDYIQTVNRVGTRIAQVADRPDYEWEFRVIASPEMNAFCLPGGKVAVHEGILPVCQNEAGLAVVMSHEIAHALARHGGERMSQTYVVNGLGTMLSYVMRNQAELSQQRLMQGYGVASKYGFVLPYSRTHESEADRIGLILMARAGYDPNEAPRFWERFATHKQGPQPPEFLSTHPSDQRRADELRAALPESLQLYAAAPQKFGLGAPLVIAATTPQVPAAGPVPETAARPVPSWPAAHRGSPPPANAAPPLQVPSSNPHRED
jgi:predicted Zn-dependent protease